MLTALAIFYSLGLAVVNGRGMLKAKLTSQLSWISTPPLAVALAFLAANLQIVSGEL